jgi:hypothetical protein
MLIIFLKSFKISFIRQFYYIFQLKIFTIINYTEFYSIYYNLKKFNIENFWKEKKKNKQKD